MAALFRDFKRSAFRMETHQTYTMPAEQENLSRFLVGEAKPEGHNSAWRDTVRANVEAGKTMQRLKVVRRPFTDYTRFLFAWAIPGNVEAREDYRILDVTAREVDIPTQDFWIFDEETVALLNFNDDGTLRERDLAGPSELDQYLELRDRALAESVPFGDYRA
ncbi:MAG: hypothetical protein GEU86_22795 [Actinophytocola sp.]|nr:hypothetical protein [Actinophytocola sp.]